MGIPLDTLLNGMEWIGSGSKNFNILLLSKNALKDLIVWVINVKNIFTFDFSRLTLNDCNFEFTLSFSTWILSFIFPNTRQV